MMAGVIVHFGRPDLTRKLAESLRCNTLVVVLHSAMEATLPEGTVLLEEPNKGFAAGLNLAARHLQQNHPEVDTVLAVNPDIEPDPRALDRLKEVHHREKADATFPTIREGKLLLQGYTLGSFGTLRRVSKGAHLFPGTCFLFSMNSWKKAGGFNEEYFHYFEDLEFCETLFRQQGRIFHAGDVVVNHAGKSGVDYPGTELPRYAVRNHLLFARKFAKMNPITFGNVCLRHFLYLFRWRAGWRGIPQWYAGIREFWDRPA